MKLTHEWQEYDMNYQKAVQDIRTKDGREYLNCWPNAGKWCVMSDNNQPDIPDAEVTHVRLNKSWMSEDQEAECEKKGRTAVIGQVDHGVSTLSAALLREVMDKDNGVIVIDNSKVISGELPERSISLNFPAPLKIPELPTHIIDQIYEPVMKTHKPNKGIRIGSYRSKKH